MSFALGVEKMTFEIIRIFKSSNAIWTSRQKVTHLTRSSLMSPLKKPIVFVSEKKNRKVPDVGTSPLDFYIDKDKAAAIGYTHDLKIDIKTGLFRKDKKFASAEDELTVETFLLQGEHELK